MKRFANGQRVTVKEGPLEGVQGTVVRLRISDDGAWVKMDKRIESNHDLFPFPAGDSRSHNTMLYPEDCQ